MPRSKTSRKQKRARPKTTKAAAKGTAAAPRLRPTWEYLLAGVIFAIGAAVRLLYFGDVPAGLNQDEAATSYDAFALSQSGADRHGHFNPVILTSWGNGQYALPAWLTIPFVKLLGLNVVSARLPYVVLGLAALPIAWLIARQMAGSIYALCALFALAICPWHIMENRWALDANIFPHIVLIAFLLLLRACDNYRNIYAFAFVLALSLYAYGTAYLFVPVFAALVLVICYRRKWLLFAPGNAKATAIAAAVATITALPIGLYLLVNMLKLETIVTPLFTAPRLPGIPRYATMASLFSADFFAQTWHNLRALADILIVSGHDGLLWNAMPAHGYLYRFAPLLWLPGLLLMAKAARAAKAANKAAPLYFMLAWFAAAAVMAIVVEPNLNRINVIFYPIIFAAAYALYHLFTKNRPTAFAAVAVLAASFAWFSHSYFGEYRDEIGKHFHESLGTAIKDAAATAPPEEIIHITAGNQPYIAALFHTQTDPREFIASAQIQSAGLEFHQVYAFGRFRFLGFERQREGVYVVHNSQLAEYDPQRFVIRRFKNYSAVYAKARYHQNEGGAISAKAGAAAVALERRN